MVLFQFAATFNISHILLLKQESVVAKWLKMESHTERLMPFFNRSNNPDLILAIQSAGVSRGRDGFRKDKSGEKLAE